MSAIVREGAKERIRVPGTAAQVGLDQWAKVIGLVTVPPLVALPWITAWTFLGWEVSAEPLAAWAWMIGCICLIPLAAYPISLAVPSIREKGRTGQRNLALVLTLAGYALGMAGVLSGLLPQDANLILTIYFASGALLVLFNKALHIKASGHACGFFAPIILSLWLYGPRALWFILLLPAVYWARLREKQHRLDELAWGSVIGAVCAGFLPLVFAAWVA